jgi:putative transposase
LKHIKQLEEENARLKRMYAELALDLEAARRVIEKSFKALPETTNRTRTARRKTYRQSRACREMKVSRSVLHYKSVKSDAKLMEMLEQRAAEHPPECFWTGCLCI